LFQFIVVFSSEGGRPGVVSGAGDLDRDDATCVVRLCGLPTGRGCPDDAARVLAACGGTLEHPRLTDADVTSSVLDCNARCYTGPGRSAIYLATANPIY